MTQYTLKYQLPVSELSYLNQNKIEDNLNFEILHSLNTEI